MFQNTCDNVSEHYRNVPEHYWKILRNTFEIFQNTFENAQEHFWKRSGTLKKCSGTLWIVSEHFWKYSGTLFENRLNVPEQYSETLVTMFWSTLLKMFRKNLECSRTLFKMFRNTFEMFPEHFWKRNTFENCLNVLEQYRNVPELFWKYCGTIFEMFRNIFEIVPKRFWNVPEHFLKNRGIMKTNISVKY